VAEEKGKTYERTNAATERAQESLMQLQQELNPLQDKVETARAAHDQMTKDVADFHTQERGIVDSMKEAQKRIKASLKDIADEEKRIEDINGGAPGRKQAEIAKAQENVTEAKEALKSHDSNRPRLEDENRGVDHKLKSLEEELRQKGIEVADSQKRLDALNNDRGNHMAGFHPNMANLLRRIQSDRSFMEKPVGPIGSHIRLLEPKWSMLVETFLGNTLNGFIVTSKRDQARLSKILQEFSMSFCPVYIGNGQAINTANHEPDPQYETILRVLEIDNELVKHQLIINQRIEQSILIPTVNQGQEIMFGGPRPRNVSQCLTYQDNNRYGLRQAFTGHGTQESLPLKLQLNQLPRMRTDSESQINNQREQSAQLSTEKSLLETRKRELQQARTKCRQALEQHKRAQSALKIQIQKAEDLVDKLQAEFDLVNVEDGRLEDYKLQLADAQRDKEMYEETYGNHGLERAKLNENALGFKRDYDAAKKIIEDHEEMIKKAQTKVRNARNARQIAVEEKNTAVDAIAGLRSAKVKEESRLERRTEQVENFIAGASETCERVPIGNGETVATLNTQLKSYKKRIDAYSKRVGADDVIIYDAFEQATKRYEAATQSYNDTSELVQLLKQTFQSRMHMFRRFQRYISSRSRINFKYLLSERAFRGKLLIDHRNKLLDVHVEPDETTRSGKGRQTKTLSGGEKSFSSICLLLALWEAMGAPLRCLDEFDVFMDDVNRDVSTKMIVSSREFCTLKQIRLTMAQISAARKAVGRQFILITPKALGAGIEAADDVQIHK
jgi:chromosome segregation ATPase